MLRTSQNVGAAVLLLRASGLQYFAVAINNNRTFAVLFTTTERLLCYSHAAFPGLYYCIQKTVAICCEVM